MQMGSVQDEAQFPAPVTESTQQGDRIGAAGKADGETKSGRERRGVERNRSSHQRMIAPGASRGCGTQQEEHPPALSYTWVMLNTRRATVEDAALITAHRKAMFSDAHDADEPVLAEMSRNFEPWVRRMLANGTYAGWITRDGDRPVASAGFMTLDWAPHFLDAAGESRGYVLNVYVLPDYRRRGLARALVQLCLDAARTRKIRVVALHASNAGRPLYEGMGFRSTSEMYFVDRTDH